MGNLFLSLCCVQNCGTTSLMPLPERAFHLTKKKAKKFVASWWICQDWRNHRDATWTTVINYLCLQVRRYVYTIVRAGAMLDPELKSIWPHGDKLCYANMLTFDHALRTILVVSCSAMRSRLTCGTGQLQHFAATISRRSIAEDFRWYESWVNMSQLSSTIPIDFSPEDPQRSR